MGQSIAADDWSRSKPDYRATRRGRRSFTLVRTGGRPTAYKRMDLFSHRSSRKSTPHCPVV
jgi:hypothetical protein